MTTGIHPLSRLYPILDAWRWAEALLNKQEEGGCWLWFCITKALTASPRQGLTPTLLWEKENAYNLLEEQFGYLPFC